MIDKLLGAIQNNEKLSEILKLVKSIGIYNSIKAIMRHPMFGGIVKNKVSELYKALVNKYEITAHSLKIVKTDDGYKVIATITIPDPKLRKDFLERLRDTIKNILTAKELTIVQPFMNEFQIRNISAKENESREEVTISLFGNEKLYGLIKEIGGDFVEEVEES